MKKSGKDRLKCVVCESTLSTAARSPFPNGEGCETRIPLSPKHSFSRVGKAKRRRLRRPKRKPTPPRCARQPLPKKGASMDTPSFQRKGGRMSPHRLPTKKAYDTRMLFSPYCHFERKREIFFVCGRAKDARIAASWKHRASSESEGRCFMQTALRKKNGNGKRKRSLGCARDDETRKRLFPFLFNLLRKPTPPRCARQPLPREGARVDTPSFLWKDVPRRGGGWMGEAVSPTQSLPRVGKVASGASRIGF